jgi:uncharacterized protein (TIGR00369 family)
VRFCILAIMMDKSTLLKKINDRNHGTLMQTLGIEFTEIGENYLVARMPVSPAVHQPDGVLHGGATAALAETVGSSAAAIFCLPKDHMLRGIEVSAKHVRGVRSGFVYAKAMATHQGKTMQVWSIEITDDQNRLVSTCSLTTLTLPIKK